MTTWNIDSWVILLSNGQSYSDHSTITVATCPSQEDADALVAKLTQWLADRPKDPDAPDEMDPLWEYNLYKQDSRHPWPFGDGTVPYEARNHLACVSAVKVPEWARDRT